MNTSKNIRQRDVVIVFLLASIIFSDQGIPEYYPVLCWHQLPINHTHYIMDVAGANVLEVEISQSPVETLDEDTRAKLVKSPKPKVTQTRKVIMSTSMAQIALLD